MNLRNVTIGTTGVMMVGTIFTPCIYDICFFVFLPFLRVPMAVSGWMDILFFCVPVWLFSSTPMLVSFMIARTVNLRILSNLILLVTAIAYGIFYVLMLSFVIPDISPEAPAVVMFMAFGILSLPVMIPAWIIALVLNRHYPKQSEPQP